jgi:hypothetical protein
LLPHLRPGGWLAGVTGARALRDREIAEEVGRGCRQAGGLAQRRRRSIEVAEGEQDAPAQVRGARRAALALGRLVDARPDLVVAQGGPAPIEAEPIDRRFQVLRREGESVRPELFRLRLPVEVEKRRGAVVQAVRGLDASAGLAAR